MLPSTSASLKRKKSVGDKRVLRTEGPTEEARFFRSDAEYNNFRLASTKLVTPLKSWDLKFLQTKALQSVYEILEHYKLVNFVTHNSVCYPRLVKMWYANLGVMTGKLSAYVMGKKLVLDVKTLAELFEMDGLAPCKLAHDFDEYNKDEAKKLLFPVVPPHTSSGKTFTTGLSIQDRLLHYTLIKCILPRQSNLTSINDDEFFLLWAFKKRIPLNIPYFILNYMGTFYTKPQSFFPFGMILTKVFSKYRVSLSLEKDILQNDSSTWINESTLHFMRMRLVDGVWVSKEDDNTSSMAEESSSTETLGLLRKLHLKLESLEVHMKEHKEALQHQIDNLDVKVESGFTELHARMNVMSSQLNQIQEQINPLD